VAGIGALQPNTAARWGLRDARGHEDPSLQRNSRLWFALGGTIEEASNGVAPQDPRTPKLLDVFGVKAVLVTPGNLGHVLAPPLDGDPVAYRGAGGTVVENPTALPQAFVAYRWRRSDDLNQSLQLMVSGTAREARDEPAIETREVPETDAPATVSDAHLVSQSDTATTLDVQARAPGYLVLLDTFYPGWRAEVDGHPVAISAANAAFRAVPVPAGRHSVHFYYRPASVIVGGAISVAAVIVLAICLLAGPVTSRIRGLPRQ
jgi:hypothetical protein